MLETKRKEEGGGGGNEGEREQNVDGQRKMEWNKWVTIWKFTQNERNRHSKREQDEREKMCKTYSGRRKRGRAGRGRGKEYHLEKYKRIYENA